MKESDSLQFDTNKVEKIITQKIFVVRGQKVMLDSDLAELYGVTTKRFNEQVKRNIERFPSDFMFLLTKEEYENLRSQIATSSLNHGGRRYLPYAFTEHGVAMLSSVLNSKIAIQMNIFIIKTFIKIRESSDKYNDIESRMVKIEKKQMEDSYLLRHIHTAVAHMIQKEGKPKGKIGFREKDDGEVD